jgi:hypothetical protein
VTGSLEEFYSWLTGGSREGEGVKVRGTTWRSHMIKLGFMGGGWRGLFDEWGREGQVRRRS